MRTRLGVIFPQTEIGDDVGIIRDYAVGVEKAGYDFLAAYDHVIGHRPNDPARWQQMGPYTDAHAFHEVFILFSYLAGITTALEFVSEVLVLPQRQTVLVAKQAAELQLLSRGRLRLGIGVGWNPEEYRALGMNFHNRGRRVVEQINVMRRLWTDELLTFQSDDHAIAAGGIRPRPPAPIPIWIGGYADVVIKRAATIADGFVLDHTLEEAPNVIARLRDALASCGRTSENFGLAVAVQLREEDLARSLDAAATWQMLGVTHLSINTMNQGIQNPERHKDLALEFIAVWKQRDGRG